LILHLLQLSYLLGKKRRLSNWMMCCRLFHMCLLDILCKGHQQFLNRSQLDKLYKTWRQKQMMFQLGSSNMKMNQLLLSRYLLGKMCIERLTLFLRSMLYQQGKIRMLLTRYCQLLQHQQVHTYQLGSW
jgi:hypothetical protein